MSTDNDNPGDTGGSGWKQTGSVAALVVAGLCLAGGVAAVEYDPGPRKVVVGTTVYSIFKGWSGLEERLAELGDLVDRMAEQAGERYGAGLDLAVLTEYAVTAGRPGDAAAVALDLDGPVRDYFSDKAREHSTYIVVPMILAEDRERGIFTNTAVLFDRTGEVVGKYRKLFPVAAPDETVLEGGLTPGTEAPVFACDFGRLGIQICYDMSFDDGWDVLAEQGPELVVWPSASPQTIAPAGRALDLHAYLVTSTPRNNATIFDPLGMIVRQIEAGGSTSEASEVMVEQIDLDFEVISWQSRLRNGAIFDEHYGDRAGYRYSPREDGGVFWSNDPEKPIDAMVDELELERGPDALARNRKLREQVLEESQAAPER